MAQFREKLDLQKFHGIYTVVRQVLIVVTDITEKFKVKLDSSGRKA